MTIRDVLEKSTKFFKEKNLETPRLDAELLIASALKLKRIDLYIHFERPLSDAEVVICRDFVRRRSQHEPVAYILGQKGFFGLDFIVSPDTLVPRPETELLVEKAVEWAKSQSLDQFTVLDLGTGSGCVGLSMAARFPHCQVSLVDVSSAALAIAQQNAKKLGVFERCRFVHSDVKDLQDLGRYDIILANPPYVATDEETGPGVREFEPSVALFAPEAGLACIKEWAMMAKPMLAEPGLIAFEIGAKQGSEAQKVFESLFESSHLEKDLSGHDRLVSAITRK